MRNTISQDEQQQIKENINKNLLNPNDINNHNTPLHSIENNNNNTQITTQNTPKTNALQNFTQTDDIQIAMVYVIQIGMVVGAGIISYGAIVAERNGRNFSDSDSDYDIWDYGMIYGTMEEELIYTPYICGIMSCITSVIGCVGITPVIGCVGAKTRNKCGMCMLLVYVIALGLSLALGIASVSQGMADKLNVYKYAQRQWDQLTKVQQEQFEWEHFCCNFNTLDPCCRFTYVECQNEYVCYEKVKDHLIENFNIIVVAATLHTVYLFIVLILTGALYIRYKWKLKQEKEKEKENVNQNECDENDSDISSDEHEEGEEGEDE